MSTQVAIYKSLCITIRFVLEAILRKWRRRWDIGVPHWNRPRAWRRWWHAKSHPARRRRRRRRRPAHHRRLARRRRRRYLFVVLINPTRRFRRHIIRSPRLDGKFNRIPAFCARGNDEPNDRTVWKNLYPRFSSDLDVTRHGKLCVPPPIVFLQI